MAKSSTDPLRTQLFELLDQVTEHQNQLRDFATSPGNGWLAKGELQSLMNLMSELESLLQDIKMADEEAGY